jgi:hypothetical protein
MNNLKGSIKDKKVSLMNTTRPDAKDNNSQLQFLES